MNQCIKAYIFKTIVSEKISCFFRLERRKLISVSKIEILINDLIENITPEYLGDNKNKISKIEEGIVKKNIRCYILIKIFQKINQASHK